MHTNFAKFQNPQWVTRLRQYETTDAFDIVLWLHDREVGYIPLQFPEPVCLVSDNTDNGSGLTGHQNP